MTAQAGGGGVGAPLRSGKKMRKRRELDALVGYASGGRRAAPLLIAGSSDDRDEPAPPPWLARRGRRPTRGPCAPAARACAALLLCACATATATVVWLFIDVREQITSLRSEMELVSMGSQSVGDALQRCHSAAKELLHNHTEMAARLDQLVLRTDNLTAEVKVLNSGLSEVTQQVAGAPELVTVPLQLKDLQTNVARFGSQLKDMDATVGALKTQANAQDDCKKNITVLESQVSQLWNRSLGVEQQHSSLQELGPLRKQQADLQASFLQLSSNVSQVNSTLTSMISWATQDYDKDHHKVVGLMESVQNNSAALSSLQTAWRQGNDVLAKNISDLSNEIADKSAEFQRQFLELKQLQQQLAAAQAQLSGQGSAPPGPSPSAPAPGGFSPPLPSSPEAPAAPAAPVPSPGMVQGSGSNDTPKKMTNAPTPFPGITQAPIPIMRAATGKPSILSSGSA